MDPATILAGFGLILGVVIFWPAVRQHRANARLQRAVRSYDEARRSRILAGEDPDAIPTAEQELTAKGHGASVRHIARLPRPDPIPVPPPPRAEPPPVPPSADPFLARLAEQAKAERMPQRRAPRRLKHKPLRPTRPPPSAPSFPTPRRRYMLTYATGWGEVTEREIRFTRAYLKGGEVYVDAFCFLRGEERTFRADRMTALFDRENGIRIASPLIYFRSVVE